MASKRVSAVIIEKGEILLVHRIKPNREYYVLPGGSVEEDESNTNALIREINEETSLEIEVGELLWEVNDIFDERIQFIYSTTKHFGKLKLGSPEKDRQSTENKYFLEWHDINDLSIMNFFPSEIKNDIIKTKRQ